MTNSFSVTIEAHRKGHHTPIVDLEQLYTLGEHLEGASIAHNQDEPVEHYSVTFTVDADKSIDAAIDGHEQWHRAHRLLELPVWDVVSIDIVHHETLAAELERPDFPELVGIAELAEMIDASRQRAHSLARSGRFPSPAAELYSGPVFLRSAVEEFLSNWERKPGRPRKLPDVVREDADVSRVYIIHSSLPESVRARARRREGKEMGSSRKVTGRKPAKAASSVMRDKRTSSKSKSAAASALSQTPSKRKSTRGSKRK